MGINPLFTSSSFNMVVNSGPVPEVYNSFFGDRLQKQKNPPRPLFLPIFSERIHLGLESLKGINLTMGKTISSAF